MARRSTLAAPRRCGAPLEGDRLIDTHCHLASEAYDADRGQVLQRAWDNGVTHIVVIGESLPAATAALELAGSDPRLSATAGIHPHDAKDWTPESATWLARTLADPRVVAAGEMGLDYHYDYSPRDAQHAAFRAQLALADDASQPVIIHAREADDDVAAVLRSDARTPVVLIRSQRPGLGGSTWGTICHSAAWCVQELRRRCGACRTARAPAHRETAVPRRCPSGASGTSRRSSCAHGGRLAAVRGIDAAGRSDHHAQAVTLFGPRLGR